MGMYSEFAELYDELMDDVDYARETEKYLSMLRSVCPAARELCDCATGTGKMAIGFAKRGMKVIASDLSQEMLRVAQKNAMKAGFPVRFIAQDMCSVSLPHRVDAVTACCDGVNYLLTEEKLALFLRSAFDALKPGGALLFDISSYDKLAHTLGDRFYGEDRDDVTYLWQNSWNEKERCVTMDLSFFVKLPDGLYRRFEEEHIQRAWLPDEITGAIAQAGFTGIQTDLTGRDRQYFMAVRPLQEGR